MINRLRRKLTPNNNDFSTLCLGLILTLIGYVLYGIFKIPIIIIAPSFIVIAITELTDDDASFMDYYVVIIPLIILFTIITLIYFN